MTIYEIKTRKNRKNIYETKSWFFEKDEDISKSLDKLKKKRKIQITNIRSDSDSMNIKRTIK
jgi:hypothetical protein